MEQERLKRAALLVATSAAFLTPFMGSALNVALPTIGRQFGADAIHLNWIVSLYILSTAIMLLPAGRLADILGRKRIFATGLILFILSSVFCALAPDVFWLVGFRVLQGFGSAMIFGTGLAIISSVYPPGERGRALGINVSAVYIGLSVGPLGGGLLTQYLGWRSIFWFTVPIAATSLFFLFRYLKSEWAEASSEKFDWKGAIFYAMALVLIMYGFSQLPGKRGILFLISGLVISAIFIYTEQRTAFPLAELTLFTRNRTFLFSSLAALINYSATFAVGFLMSLYLQYVKDLDPREAGLVMGSQPVIQALLSPFSGRLSDKIEPGVVASSGMAMSALGLIVLCFIDSDTSMVLIIAVLITMGGGFALFSSPNTNAIMSSVERKYYGIASGTVGTMRMIGQMLSMATALLMFTFFIGHAEITAETSDRLIISIKYSFVIFSALCVMGIFFSLGRGKLRREEI